MNIKLFAVTFVSVIFVNFNCYSTDQYDGDHRSFRQGAISYEDSSVLGVLPTEALQLILSHLQSTDDIKRFGSTSKFWNAHLLRAKNVIVIGSKGSGKSTLTHLLMGHTLNAQVNIKLGVLLCHFESSEELKEIKISKGLFNASTKDASFVYDLAHQRMIWDCPNFIDETFGGEEDLYQNATRFYNLLKGTVRVILVISPEDIQVGKGYSFKRIFNLMTKCFSDQEQLKQLLSLVFTHIPEEVDNKSASDYVRACISGLTPGGQDLLNSLLTTPGHFAVFKKPGQNGEYILNEDLKQLMNVNEAYVFDPKTTPPEESDFSKG